MAHDMEMVGALGAIGFERQLERCVRQELVIAMGDAAAFARPSDFDDVFQNHVWLQIVVGLVAPGVTRAAEGAVTI